MNVSGEGFGDKRIEELLEIYSADSADLTADHIIEQVFKWAGRPQETSLDDDWTLIITDFA